MDFLQKKVVFAHSFGDFVGRNFKQKNLGHIPQKL